VLCGSDDAEVAAAGRDFEYDTVDAEFRFVRCRGCGHVYLNPRPSAADLGVIYPPNYYAFSDGGNSLVARLRRRWEGGKVGLIRQLVGPGRRRLLDIGCGNGRVLGLLRDFGAPEWELVGIDFDPEAVRACRARGFEAHACRAEEFEQGAGTYDAVIMLQLIEHVEDPRRICARVHALLRPGGWFIVETPNLAGLDYRAFRGRWWGHYHFPRHWNLFSAASLRRMLESEGFEIVRSESLISTSAWIISLHNAALDRGWPAAAVRFFHYRNPLLLAVFVALDWVRAQLGGETSNQRVIARKRAPVAPTALPGR
jgi:2-polyprenyl-3-methyl-5-hydroxy-6-metoxy-1,4-benzoquinol methylase